LTKGGLIRVRCVDSRDTVLTRLLLRHLPLYLFNSFFSSLRKRQSVP
jgi:hypothetical protein